MGRIADALRHLADKGHFHGPSVEPPARAAGPAAGITGPPPDIAGTPAGITGPLAEGTSPRAEVNVPQAEGSRSSADNGSSPAVATELPPATSELPAEMNGLLVEANGPPASAITAERLEGPGSGDPIEPLESRGMQAPPEIEIDWWAEDPEGGTDPYYTPAIPTLAELEDDDPGEADTSAY